MSIASFFGRDTVALPGFHKFFTKQYKEEREHAEKLIAYQAMRGGKTVLSNLVAPPTADLKSAREAVEISLAMEKEINAKLLKLHGIAEAQNDAQLCDFIESEYLMEQVESMKEIADMLTNLTRVGNDGLGLYLLDKELEGKLK